jgi:hypothetical protein
VYFVLLAAALAIMAGVVAVAMGWGGEMTEFAPDRPAMQIRVTSAADVAALRLPLRPVGYQQHATEEALRAVTIVLAEREAEIARLRAELAGPGLPSASGRSTSELSGSELSASGEPALPPVSPASSPAASPAPPA